MLEAANQLKNWQNVLKNYGVRIGELGAEIDFLVHDKLQKLNKLDIVDDNRSF